MMDMLIGTFLFANDASLRINRKVPVFFLLTVIQLTRHNSQR